MENRDSELTFIPLRIVEVTVQMNHVITEKDAVRVPIVKLPNATTLL